MQIVSAIFYWNFPLPLWYFREKWPCTKFEPFPLNLPLLRTCTGRFRFSLSITLCARIRTRGFGQITTTLCIWLNGRQFNEFLLIRRDYFEYLSNKIGTNTAELTFIFDQDSIIIFTRIYTNFLYVNLWIWSVLRSTTNLFICSQWAARYHALLIHQHIRCFVLS